MEFIEHNIFPSQVTFAAYWYSRKKDKNILSTTISAGVDYFKDETFITTDVKRQSQHKIINNNILVSIKNLTYGYKTLNKEVDTYKDLFDNIN